MNATYVFYTAKNIVTVPCTEKSINIKKYGMKSMAGLNLMFFATYGRYGNYAWEVLGN